MSSSSEPAHGAESFLRTILTTLFEAPEEICSILVPQLLVSFDGNMQHLRQVPIHDIIGESIRIIHGWNLQLQARFIAGHPRIGETKNLSSLSAKEQSGGTNATMPTPPEVLLRLQHLNACYEHVYPGLRYITFVNGRSRAAIAEEMEDKLGIVQTLSPDEPPLMALIPFEVYSTTWIAELQRAIEDIGRIARSRLEKLEHGAPWEL